MTAPSLTLKDLEPCFSGLVPSVIATVSADGVPNVTYLSRVLCVDAQHLALSNQYFSKTAQNLTAVPHASVLMIDPQDYAQYVLTITFARREESGELFERMRDDIEAIAALTGMQGVFRLRSADVYRVDAIERVPTSWDFSTPAAESRAFESSMPVRLAELTMRLGRCEDLDSLVSTTLEGLDELFGYPHSILMLTDESGRRLFTIGSHGYQRSGVGSEVAVGEGVLGMAAARRQPMRVSDLHNMLKYARSVRRGVEQQGGAATDEVALPGLPGVRSQLAVPAVALGEVVGVLAVESVDDVAFSDDDEALLVAVAGIVANGIELDVARERDAPAEAPAPSGGGGPSVAAVPPVAVRFYAADGSTFLDDEYLIKGVAGRILWSLLRQHERDGRTEFTNREVRLDPSLELPEFRDNLESRLILLKRRLDEREAPVRIEKTGRGRFRIVVSAPLTLTEASTRLDEGS